MRLTGWGTIPDGVSASGRPITWGHSANADYQVGLGVIQDLVPLHRQPYSSQVWVPPVSSQPSSHTPTSRDPIISMEVSGSRQLPGGKATHAGGRISPCLYKAMPWIQGQLFLALDHCCPVRSRAQLPLSHSHHQGGREASWLQNLHHTTGWGIPREGGTGINRHQTKGDIQNWPMRTTPGAGDGSSRLPQACSGCVVSRVQPGRLSLPSDAGV